MIGDLNRTFSRIRYPEAVVIPEVHLRRGNLDDPRAEIAGFAPTKREASLEMFESGEVKRRLRAVTQSMNLARQERRGAGTKSESFPGIVTFSRERLCEE